MAEGASDAAGQVDRTGLERCGVPRAGNRADTVHRADHQAGFATGTHVFVKKGKSFGKFFLGHGGWIVGSVAFPRKRGLWFRSCVP